MEPFDQNYHTESDEEAAEKFDWPSSNMSATLSARHAALMRDELEISPLVPAVPPMPGERSTDLIPGLPSSFKSSTQGQNQPLLALKKRQVAEADVFGKDDFDAQHSFEGNSQGVNLTSVTDISKKDPAEEVQEAVDTGKRKLEEIQENDVIDDGSQAKKMRGADDFGGATDPPTRPNIRDIVLGSTSPAKSIVVNAGETKQERHEAPAPVVHQTVATEASKVAHDAGIVPPAAVTSLSTEAVETLIADEKKRKKSNSKPFKKFLVAKKEQDQAYSFVQGKDDLLDCLDKADCVFLADQLWVFTVQQLSAILFPAEQSQSTAPKATSNEGISPEVVQPTGGMSASGADSEMNGIVPDETEKHPREITEPTHDAVDEQVTSVESENRNTDMQDENGGGIREAFPEQCLSNDPSESSDEGIETLVQLMVAKKHVNKSCTTESAEVTENTERDRLAALAKVLDWKERIMNYRQDQSKSSPVEKRFPLDGPISRLIPTTTRNFLASVRIDTIFRFLSLKRTETGAICDMMKIWRRHCHLSSLSPLAIAKHMLGVTSRIEYALETIPHVTASEMAWMADPIIIMTGAAREFLVDDQKITSARRFVDLRTKNLAANLELWRQQKNLPPLKGSGKVAMVSGWKAAAREALDAEEEPGMIVRDVDFEALASSETPIVNETFAAGIAPVSSAKSSSIASIPQSPEKIQGPEKVESLASNDRQMKYALNAQLFLEDVLGQTVVKLLSAVNIRSAGDLFQVSGDDILRSKLYEHMRLNETAKDNIQCKTLLKSWCDKLEKELDQFRTQKKKATRKREPKREESIERTERADSKMNKNLKDPFLILSAVTQNFLHSLNIRTAEDFLSSRTTDLADAFVRWREEVGMPVLKGQGAIASVSGWKASCRKAASMLGMEEVSRMEPIGRAPHSVKSSKVERIRSYSAEPQKSVKREFRQSIPTESVLAFMQPSAKERLECKVSLDDVLCGSNSCTLAVGSVDGSTHYHFQLQLRKLDSLSPFALFITYTGDVPNPELHSTSEADSERRIKFSLVGSEESSLELPIMNDVRSTNRTRGFSAFASSLPGMGLLELKQYGARPVRAQSLDALQDEIKDFVLNGSELAALPSIESTSFANVALHRQPLQLGVQYLLYMSVTMEKGQSTEVVFPDVNDFLKSGAYQGFKFEKRHLLADALHLLCMKDLRSLADYLENDLLQLLGHDPASEQDMERLKQVFAARRRLHWISHQVHQLVNKTGSLRIRMGKLYFGCLSLGSMNTIELEAAVISLRQEVRAEMLALLEIDNICGSAIRSDWCPLFERTLETFSEIFLNFYCRSNDSRCVDELLSLWGSMLQNHFSDQKDEDYFLQCMAGDDGDLMSALMRLCESFMVAQGVSSNEIDAMCSDMGILKTLVCAPRPSEQVPELQTIQRFKETNSFVDYTWYKRRQWELVCSLFKGLGSLLLSEERQLFFDPSTVSNLKIIAATRMGQEPSDPVLPATLLLRVPMITIDAPLCVPHALPLFLGIVWPALKQSRWKVEADDESATISAFVMPSKGRQNSSENSRAKRNKMRTRYARECRDLGFGDLSKLAKRLFVRVANMSDRPGVMARSGTKTAEAVLKEFMDDIIANLDVDDQHGHTLAKKIADALLDCFTTIAPLLKTHTRNESLDDKSNEDENDTSSPQSGCDALMRFLLVLPGILPQCNVPLKAIHDCQDTVNSLLDFMTSNYLNILDGHLHPPQELYKDDKTAPAGTSLISRLQSLANPSALMNNSDSSVNTRFAGVMTEVVPESEKDQLTTFLVRVLEQAVPCRANETDCQKKNRRIHVGFPGFSCRHCRGGYGEGRYFFTTIESLTTAYCVFEKHVLKCPDVPADIKTEVITTKLDHTDERKNLPPGSQQAFFNRLWDRLRYSEIEGVVTRVYLPDKDADDASNEEKSSSISSFPDYLSVLAFLRTSNQLSSSRSLSEAVNLYYNALEYGGRVSYTPAQPSHFSSEWLIRKIIPKMKWRPKKVHMMPG